MCQLHSPRGAEVAQDASGASRAHPFSSDSRGLLEPGSPRHSRCFNIPMSPGLLIGLESFALKYMAPEFCA